MRPNSLVAFASLGALGTPVAAVPATQFQARILALHNAERSAVRLPPLVWDNGLAVGATAWAQHMALTGVFDHSDRHARRGIGENIWNGQRGAFSIDNAVRLWISDKRTFIPGIFPNVSTTGWYSVSHYTQVIWPTTRRVGCGLASNRSVDYLVCRYSPAGNIDGRRVP
ncbi:MAG TPA: CAP domain-containing protein [Sphingomicrobium sp.]|nr:CAP domain-containing protein [Sphingomicrobium sp.]